MKIIYFDLDNTILDFDKCEKEALKNLLSLYGLELTEKHISSYSKINNKCWSEYEKGFITKEQLRSKRFDIFFKTNNIEEKSKIDHSNEYLNFLKEKSNFIPGAKELLVKLKKDNFKMACLTNGIKEVQESRISKSGLNKYFDFLLTSEEVGTPKPHPLIFYRASEISKIPLNESIYIGDSLSSDFLGAKNAGIPFILFWNKPLEILFDLKLEKLPKNICTSFRSLYKKIREI